MEPRGGNDQLDLSPEAFLKIFREKAKEELGFYLMRKGSYYQKIKENEEVFTFIKNELEKHIYKKKKE